MNIYAFSPWRTSLIATALMIFASGSAAAHVSVWVSNRGADSGSCGLPTSPCRSISQAIQNASSGDTIWVGAGHYGNVSGQPGFGGPGDEQPQLLPSQDNSSGLSGCIVCVTKALNIYSLDGAGAAVIDSGPSPGSYNATVVLLVDGSAFGSPGHGFTITGGNAYGVALNMQFWRSSRSGVSVYANVDINDATGFFVFGPDGYGPLTGCAPVGLCPTYNGTVLLQGNEADNNAGIGFWVQPRNVQPRNVNPGVTIRFIVQENVTHRAGTGFRVEPGTVGNCDDCFDDGSAPTVTFAHNFASAGGAGFYARNAGPVHDNVATDNALYGFLVVSNNPLPPFYRNSAIGNAGPGLIVALEAFPFGRSTPNFGTTLTLDENNFFGNDRNRPDLQLGDYGGPLGPDFDLGPSAHCGIVNMGAVWGAYSGFFYPPPSPPFPTETMLASHNYWGSPQGPSASGAGDAAGGACDETGGVTVTAPSKPAETPITPLPYPLQ